MTPAGRFAYWGYILSKWQLPEEGKLEAARCLVAVYCNTDCGLGGRDLQFAWELPLLPAPYAQRFG